MQQKLPQYSNSKMHTKHFTTDMLPGSPFKIHIEFTLRYVTRLALYLGLFVCSVHNTALQSQTHRWQGIGVEFLYRVQKRSPRGGRMADACLIALAEWARSRPRVTSAGSRKCWKRALWRQQWMPLIHLLIVFQLDIIISISISLKAFLSSKLFIVKKKQNIGSP